MKTPNVLLLSLAISIALSACSGDQAPKPAPEAPKADATVIKAELPPLAAFNVGDLDTSKNACTNLADFVNSKWLAANPVPADKTSWGSFEMLDERAEAASKLLVEAAATKKDASGLENWWAISTPPAWTTRRLKPRASRRSSPCWTASMRLRHRLTSPVTCVRNLPPVGAKYSASTHSPTSRTRTW